MYAPLPPPLVPYIVFEVSPTLLMQLGSLEGVKAIGEYVVASSLEMKVKGGWDHSVLADECFEWVETACSQLTTSTHSAAPKAPLPETTTTTALINTTRETTTSAASKEYVRSFLLADEYLPAFRRILSPEDQTVRLLSRAEEQTNGAGGGAVAPMAPFFHLPAGNAMEVLVAVLGKHAFLAGSKVSLADIRLATLLFRSAMLQTGPECLRAYADRVFETLGVTSKLSECLDKIPVPSRDFSVAPETALQPSGIGDKFYLTTAINYTNGSPHCGHAYEAVTSDIISRCVCDSNQHACSVVLAPLPKCITTSTFKIFKTPVAFFRLSKGTTAFTEETCVL
jgi:hypothetical protein